MKKTTRRPVKAAKKPKYYFVALKTFNWTVLGMLDNGFIFAEAKVSKPGFCFIDLYQQRSDVQIGLARMFKLKDLSFVQPLEFRSLADFASWYAALVSPSNAKKLSDLTKKFKAANPLK